MTESEKIQKRFPIVLDNFSLASHLAGYLIEVHLRKVKPPVIQIILDSDIGHVIIPGTNCGLFTTPVIHQACIDVRRTLTFFNLRYGYKKGEIEQHVDAKYGDNWNILDAGLTSVSPQSFCDLSIRLLGTKPDEIIKDMLMYTDKQLAHYTDSEYEPDLINVQKSCTLMTEAILEFIYDAANIERPKVQPQKKES